MKDFSDYQKQYGELPFEERQAHFRKRKLLEVLANYRPRRILEIGCGLDAMFNHWPHFDSFTVVEPGNAFAARATKQGADRRDIAIIHGSLEDNVARLALSSYDFILLSSLLHEVPDCEALLRTTSQLCDHATVVHVNVPNAYSFHRLLACAMGLIETPFEHSDTQRRMQQSHTFDIETLVALASKCGFEVLEQGTFFVKPFTHLQMEFLRESGFLTDSMLDGLYKLSAHLPSNGSEIFMNLRRQG